LTWEFIHRHFIYTKASPITCCRRQRNPFNVFSQ
jgi:hypothetical protein